MSSFAKFGNELYTGKRSYDFVGSKKIWFAVAAVAVALSILIPVVKGGFNLGIEFRGGSEFTVSNVKTTEASVGEKAVHDVVPGSVPRVANVAGTTMRIQTDKLSDDETLKIKEGLTKAYGVTDNEVTSTFVGPTWGADVTKQALIGLVVFVALATVLMALYFRTWKMSLSAIAGMLVTMFITAGVYALSDFEVTPSAIIGFLTVLSYSLYDTVVVFDKIREKHGRHRILHAPDLRRGSQPGGQPDPGPLHQHHDGGHPSGRGDPLHRGRPAGCGNPARPFPGPVRRDPDRHRGDHLHRGADVCLAAPGRGAAGQAGPACQAAPR
jgi:preprotein translocase SecF subunit